MREEEAITEEVIFRENLSKCSDDELHRVKSYWGHGDARRLCVQEEILVRSAKDVNFDGCSDEKLQSLLIFWGDGHPYGRCVQAEIDARDDTQYTFMDDVTIDTELQVAKAYEQAAYDSYVKILKTCHVMMGEPAGRPDCNSEMLLDKIAACRVQLARRRYAAGLDSREV